MIRNARRVLLGLVTLLIMTSLSLQHTGAATSQSLTVDATTPISRIEHPFWGVNYVAFWDDIQGNEASREALRNAGIQLIRFPGGEPANWLDWSKPDRSPYWTTTSTDELWAYAQGVGAGLLLQTNPTTNRISETDERNDPSGAQAAGWVSYTSQQNIDARYWEIGNEPDLTLTSPMNWSALQWYFDAFNDQAAAMKAANPDVRVLGPVGTNAWQWWGLGSLEMFLARTGNRQGSGLVDGVSLHYYNYNNGDCAGWDQVRAFGQSWLPNMEFIRSTIATYDTRPLPVFISETNAAVSALNCEINQTMASALANADLLGAYRASGVQAVQFFGAIHGGNGWGLLYGAGEARPADTPTPTYFVFPLWTQSGNEVLQVTGLTDPANEVSAYASRHGDGSLQVIAINKSADAQSLSIGFRGVDPTGGSVEISELRPADGGVWDKEVVYNRVRMPDVTAASLPAPLTRAVSASAFSWTVPAYSLTMFNFKPDTPAPTFDYLQFLPMLER